MLFRPLTVTASRCSACLAPLRRSLSTSIAQQPSQKSRQRLFLAGLNPFLPSNARNASCPTFTEVPLSTWLESIGVDEESASSPDITHLEAGFNHTLIAFRDATGTESVFAIGRNESGQLGIGYNSQEPTRGLVEGFSGDYIESIRCGITSSYIQVRQGDQSVLYSFGSKARGQLGLEPDPSRNGTPMQSFASRATLVPSASSDVASIAAGFEHALALTTDGTLLGTGVNTDGQLGIGDDKDRHAFTSITLPEQLQDEGIASIHAGGDTSAVISKEGDLWSFGNSEYAQAFHGQKIDRILEPKLMDWALIGLPKVVDFQIGGSFALLLNEEGLVYAAGYGAVGQGESSLETIKPQRVRGLENIVSIKAANGYALAINDRQEVYVWGLNSEYGRLATGTKTNVYEAAQLDTRGLIDTSRQKIDKVALGSQTCFLLLQD